MPSPGIKKTRHYKKKTYFIFYPYSYKLSISPSHYLCFTPFCFYYAWHSKRKTHYLGTSASSSRTYVQTALSARPKTAATSLRYQSFDSTRGLWLFRRRSNQIIIQSYRLALLLTLRLRQNSQGTSLPGDITIRGGRRSSFLARSLNIESLIFDVYIIITLLNILSRLELLG
jgi:hypothetical protein